MFQQLSFDVVCPCRGGILVAVVEQQPGTKARTCCVGLNVWGVVRLQECLLLHYSVSCVEALQNRHLLNLQSFSASWGWITWRPGWIYFKLVALSLWLLSSVVLFCDGEKDCLINVHWFTWDCVWQLVWSNRIFDLKLVQPADQWVSVKHGHAWHIPLNAPQACLHWPAGTEMEAIVSKFGQVVCLDMSPLWKEGRKNS